MGYPSFKGGKGSTVDPKDSVFPSPDASLAPREESRYPRSSEGWSRLLAQITFLLQAHWRNSTILDGSSTRSDNKQIAFRPSGRVGAA